MYREIPIPYKINRHPRNTSIDEFSEDPDLGANCQLSTLGLTVWMGRKASQKLSSEEWYYDREYSEPVKNLDEIQTGDVVGLCSQEQGTFRLAHVGVGLMVEGVTHLVHNSNQIGFMVIEPLEEVMIRPEYEVVAFVRRLKMEDPDSADHDKLRKYQLHELIPTT